MIQQISRIKSTRQYLLNLIDGLTIEQLNETPEGFNNNIIWNMAHLTAVQQAVCYKRAGLQPIVQEKYLSPYLPNTKPEQFVDSSEVEILKSLLLSSLDEFESSYKKSFFTNYKPFTTRYGVEINNIDDALNFVLYHEGYHTGIITAFKRLVKG